MPVFSHEIVPDHLRTKPDPEVEEQEKQLSAEAARIGQEVAQVTPMTPVTYSRHEYPNFTLPFRSLDWLLDYYYTL